MQLVFVSTCDVRAFLHRHPCLSEDQFHHAAEETLNALHDKIEVNAREMREGAQTENKAIR